MAIQTPDLASIIDNFTEEYFAIEGQIDREQDARSKTQLERKKSKMCRDMASTLDQLEDFGNRRSGTWRDPNNGRGTTLERRWVVSGVPSKARRAAAQEWMQSIGLEWDGSAPDLRREVHAAVARGETAPGDWFGLTVEWTVFVERDLTTEKFMDGLQTILNDKRNS